MLTAPVSSCSSCPSHNEHTKLRRHRRNLSLSSSVICNSLARSILDFCGSSSFWIVWGVLTVQQFISQAYLLLAISEMNCLLSYHEGVNSIYKAPFYTPVNSGQSCCGANHLKFSTALYWVLQVFKSLLYLRTYLVGSWKRCASCLYLQRSTIFCLIVAKVFAHRFRPNLVAIEMFCSLMKTIFGRSHCA